MRSMPTIVVAPTWVEAPRLRGWGCMRQAEAHLSTGPATTDWFEQCAVAAQAKTHGAHIGSAAQHAQCTRGALSHLGSGGSGASGGRPGLEGVGKGEGGAGKGLGGGGKGLGGGELGTGSGGGGRMVGEGGGASTGGGRLSRGGGEGEGGGGKDGGPSTGG